MQVFDPSRAYNAFTAGAQLGGAMRQQETERMAAPAISAGNYGQAAEIYGQRGDVAGAAGYRQMYEQQLAQMDEQQKAQALERNNTLARAAMSVRQVPYEQRKQVLMQQAPVLAQMGIDTDMLAQFDPTDDAINGVMSQVMELDQLLKAQAPVTLSPGAALYTPGGEMLAQNVKPEETLTPYQKEQIRLSEERLRMDRDRLTAEESRRIAEAEQKASIPPRPLIGAEGMARVAAGIGNMRSAVQDLQNLIVGQGYQPGQDWGALAVENVPGFGDIAARAIGGEDYQRFDNAYASFEAAALPIMSGAAVTESEGRRILRALRIRIGDSPQARMRKLNNMNRMVEGLEMAARGDASFLRETISQIDNEMGGGVESAEDIPQSAINEGVTPDMWKFMSDEDRALFIEE